MKERAFIKPISLFNIFYCLHSLQIVGHQPHNVAGLPTMMQHSIKYYDKVTDYVARKEQFVAAQCTIEVFGEMRWPHRYPNKKSHLGI